MFLKLTLCMNLLHLISCILFVISDKPAKAVVTSELPLGSGLGSSAALCVAFSAALLALSDSSKLDFSHKGWQVFGDSELELVNKWAFEGEKIIHGRPSGIDNTVSTYGMLKFSFHILYFPCYCKEPLRPR